MMRTRAEKIHDLLTGDDEGRVCRDIPEEACRHQPTNFLTHVGSLAATKTGDGLADPKLVLSWLLTALGAPTAMIGLLVPIREAGSLLPQLFTAGYIRRLPRRKWAWAAGSFIQGLAVAGMAGAALTLEGAAAGGVILALLAVFAVARSVCSVSYKDVLGKTVSKTTRGTATGAAATVASALVFVFGALLALQWLPLTVPAIAGALVVAALLWLASAALFSTLAEAPGATEGGGQAFAVALKHFSLLRDDGQLARFIITRGLLTSTALAPPFLLTLDSSLEGRRLGALGFYVLASAGAGVSSNYIWGRLSDRSSRKVLILTGLVGAASLACAAVVGWADPGGALTRWSLPILLLVLMIAYQGVRIGRSTHLVDMATEPNRAAYTALSNTLIGVILLLAGGFGLIAQAFGPAAALASFAGMSLASSFVALGLREVQQHQTSVGGEDDESDESSK